MKPIPVVLAAVAALIVAPLLYLPFAEPQQESERATLPWQIEVDANGHSTVFGFTLGVSTLGDVHTRYGSDTEIAVITPKDGTSSLEAFNAEARAGFITGKMVFTAELAQEAVDAMRERAPRSSHMESTTRKATLHPDDFALALQTPIRAIGFIPTADLDAATIVQRFGEPAVRLRSAENLEHFLYPERGLEVILDSRGKELLQYVAPRDFARLHAPLLADGAAPDTAVEPADSQ